MSVPVVIMRAPEEGGSPSTPTASGCLASDAVMTLPGSATVLRLRQIRTLPNAVSRPARMEPGSGDATLGASTEGGPDGG
jgi:hypothetical protein